MSDPINPNHYKSHPSGIEIIELTRWMPFNLGNAFKYLARADHKNETPTEDLRKALWYVEDFIFHYPTVMGWIQMHSRFVIINPARTFLQDNTCPCLELILEMHIRQSFPKSKLEELIKLIKEKIDKSMTPTKTPNESIE